MRKLFHEHAPAHHDDLLVPEVGTTSVSPFVVGPGGRLRARAAGARAPPWLPRRARARPSSCWTVPSSCAVRARPPPASSSTRNQQFLDRTSRTWPSWPALAARGWAAGAGPGMGPGRSRQGALHATVGQTGSPARRVAPDALRLFAGDVPRDRILQRLRDIRLGMRKGPLLPCRLSGRTSSAGAANPHRSANSAQAAIQAFEVIAAFVLGILQHWSPPHHGSRSAFAARASLLRQANTMPDRVSRPVDSPPRRRLYWEIPLGGGAARRPFPPVSHRQAPIVAINAPFAPLVTHRARGDRRKRPHFRIDHFLNHRIEPAFMTAMGEALADHIGLRPDLPLTRGKRHRARAGYCLGWAGRWSTPRSTRRWSRRPPSRGSCRRPPRAGRRAWWSPRATCSRACAWPSSTTPGQRQDRRRAGREIVADAARPPVVAGFLVEKLFRAAAPG